MLAVYLLVALGESSMSKTRCLVCHRLSSLPQEKKRPRKHLKTTFDDFDLTVIRKTIHEFHLNEGERPSLRGLLRVLKDKIDFKGSIWCVRKVVKKLGFRWKKTESNRRLLVEKSDIRNLRLNDLVNVD